MTDENIVANEVCGDASATPARKKDLLLQVFFSVYRVGRREPMVRSSFDGQSLTDEYIVANEVCGDASATPTIQRKGTALHSFEIATTEILIRNISYPTMQKDNRQVAFFVFIVGVQTHLTG